jgi:ankyrin repeat protein
LLKACAEECIIELTMTSNPRLPALCVLCSALFLVSPFLRGEGIKAAPPSIGGVEVDPLLYDALQRNDFNRLRSVVEGSPGSLSSAAGTRLFLGMCLSGNLEGVAMLLDMGADANASGSLDLRGQSREADALSAAVESRRVDAVDYLLSRGARLSVAAYNAAIRTGQRVLAGDLKAKGAAPYSEEIVAAAAKGYLVAMRALLKKGAGADAMNRTGDTPLTAAAAAGQLAAVRLLIENGAGILDTDFRGRTARSLAEKAGHEQVAQLLGRVGDDTQDFLFRIALSAAVVKKDAAQAAKLLPRASDPDLAYAGWEDMDQFFRGQPPRLVEVACGLGSAEIVKAFIAKGADVVKDARCLFYAAGSGHRDIVALLLDLRSTNPAASGADKVRLLEYAAGLGDIPLCDLIVSKAGELLAARAEGMQALVAAAAFLEAPGSGSRAARELLAASGINGATQDEKDAALRLALEAGDFTRSRSLLAKGALPRSGGPTKGPLALSIQAGADLDLIHELLSRGADVNDRGQSEMSAINLASWRQRPDVVKLLLEHGANPNLQEPGGDTPLMESLRGPREIIEMLLAAGADLDVKCTFFDGYRSTALMRAPEDGDMDKIALLLSKAPKVALADKLGLTAIDYIRDSGAWNREIARSLAKAYNVDPSADAKADLRLRLTLALMTGDYAAAGAYIAKGAEIEAAGYLGETSLMGFAENGDLAAVKFLLAQGADPLKTDAYKNAAVAHAAARGHLEIVKLLLPSKAAHREQGELALASAAAGGHVKVMEYLLDQGFSVNSADYQGSPALMLAAKARKTEAVKLLLKKGAVINPVSPAFTWINTPLACAAENGDAEMVKLLLAAGANAAVGDGDALISALGFGPNLDAAKLIIDRMTPAQRKTACARTLTEVGVWSVETLRFLLDSGAPPDGATLTKAIGYYRNREMALLLLERGAPAGFRDPEGNTPLCLAIAQWGPDMVNRLLAKGADPMGMFVPMKDWPPRDEPERIQEPEEEK